MDIRKLYYLEGAKNAEGFAVIIDVFRAFSTACYVFGSGAERIILSETPEEALRLKKENPGYILAGERGGKMVEGFDFGNSPSAFVGKDLSGETVILTTSAGTRGIIAARNSDEIITGSFVNAAAVAEYIRQRNPGRVSLVCMGWNACEPADEDRLYADYIQGCLEGNPPDFVEIKKYIQHESLTKSFLYLGSEPSAPKEDLARCLSLDRFNFVLRAENRELKKTYPSKIFSAS